MDMKVTVDEKKKKITIEMDIEECPSKSGKNVMIAKSGGNKITDALYKGKPVVVGLNAYINKEKKEK